MCKKLVPCDKRVKDLVAEAKSIRYKSADIPGDDGWVISIAPENDGDDEVPDMEVPELDDQVRPKSQTKAEASDDDDDDIPDMDGFDEDNLEDDPVSKISKKNFYHLFTFQHQGCSFKSV